ncbi:MAG: hypothetical protein OET90_05390 [Desulfuromonadales bacterium]|nr:hypothetical protein [Desulfuromonadales bacterium]
MKKSIHLLRLATYSLSILLLLSGCSEDPNEAANKLFVEASKQFDQARAETTYKASWQAYTEAAAKLDQITSKYQTSNIAVSLVSGQAKLSNYSLDKFRAVEDPLKRLAEAEQSPLSFAYLLTENLDIEDWEKKSLLNDIIISLAMSGDMEKASEIINSSMDAKDRDSLLLEALFEVADSGDYSRATTLKESITESSPKAMASYAIAKALAKAGELKKAQQMLDQTEGLLASIEDQNEKAYCRVIQAEALIEAGQTDKAKQIVLAELEKAKSAQYKSYVLINIVRAFVKLNQFESAVTAASLLEDKDRQVIELSLTAKALAEQGDKKQAEQILASATKLAADVEKDYKAKYALEKIASVHAEIGNYDEALETIQAIPFSPNRTSSLASVAKGCAASGDTEKALSMMKAIADNLGRAEVLCAIANEHFEKGESEFALYYLSQACEQLKAEEKGYKVAFAIDDIVEGYHSSNNKEQGLNAVFDLLQQIQSDQDKAKILTISSKVWTPSDNNINRLRTMLHDQFAIGRFWRT